MKNLVFIPIFAFLFWACEDSVNSTTSTGTIAGKVKLTGGSNNDYSGVEIVLDKSPRSTISDVNGNWELSNVPAGVYKVTFDKLGYFTTEYYNFQFIGKDTYYFQTVYLGKIPPERVTQLDVWLVDTTSIYFSGLISAPVQNTQFVMLLVSKTPLANTIPIEALAVTEAGVPQGTDIFGVYFHPEWQPDISSGDTLYAVAFLGDDQTRGVSYNPINNTYIFNTPGGEGLLSNVVSVIVP